MGAVQRKCVAYNIYSFIKKSAEMADFFITKRIGCIGVLGENMGKNKNDLCRIFLLASIFMFLLDCV